MKQVQNGSNGQQPGYDLNSSLLIQAVTSKRCVGRIPASQYRKVADGKEQAIPKSNGIVGRSRWRNNP